VCGTAWCWTIHSPVFKCHQTSGSRTLRAPIANRPMNTAITNARRNGRNSFIVGMIPLRASGRSYNPESFAANAFGDDMKRRTIKKAVYGALAGTLMIHAFLFWHDRALIAKGYPDFTIFYSAGLMVRQGLGRELYNDVEQSRVQKAFAPGVEIRQGPLPYMHPPFEALVFAPLTFLSYPAAYAVWDLFNLGLLALAPVLLRRSVPVLGCRPWVVWLLAELAFFPVFMALLQGQDVILLFLLESLAFRALVRNSNFLSGCWLGLGSFKPHLILPIVLIVALGWKRPKVLLGFLATCFCLGVVSIAIVGWPQALRYPEYLFHLESVGANGAIMAAIVPNLRGLLEGWKMSAGVLHAFGVLTLILSLVLLAWAIGVSRKYFNSPIGLLFALAATTSVLVSYHAFLSDLTLLLVPLAASLSFATSSRFQLSRDLPFLLPAGLLLFTPVYLLLLFRFERLNLLALVLLLWLYEIQARIKAEPHARQSDQDLTPKALS
jgi:hypothetical protein